MPSLETLPSGKTRFVVWRHGRKYQDTRNTRAAARSFALDLEDLIDNGHVVDHPKGTHPATAPPSGVEACCRPADPPRAMTVTFGDWRKTWWEAISPRRATSTRAKNESYIAHHIAPHFDDRLLGPDPEKGIVRSRVQTWVNELPLAPSTVAAVHALLVEILTAAVGDGILDINPARGVTLPTDDADEVVHLDNLAQAVDIAERLGEHWGTLYLTGVLSGCRTSELLGFRVEDWDGSALHIREPTRTIVRGPLVETEGHLEHKAPKTAAGVRTVLIPAFWRPRLDALAERREQAAKPCELCDRPHLFVGTRGALVRRSNLRQRVWKPAAAGVRAGLTFKGATRHTHEAIMEQWVPETARRRRLGHAVHGMSGVYGHDTPDMQQLILSGWAERWTAATERRPGWWTG